MASEPQGKSMARRRRAAAQRQNSPPSEEEEKEPKSEPRSRQQKRKQIPTVDVHLRVALEDLVIRISAADWQKLVIYWKLGAEDVILRGPYAGMETDIVLRGTDGGMVSVRPHVPGPTKIPGFKLVRAVDMRKEMLAQAGL